MTGNTLVPGKASETELCRMMDEYSSMLVGICAILLDDRDLAQDVVQETFIRVYKKMDSFRGARPESEKLPLFLNFSLHRTACGCSCKRP